MRIRDKVPAIAGLAMVCLAGGGFSLAAGADTTAESAGGDEVDITTGMEPSHSIREDRFIELDLDKDGFLTLEELRKDRPQLESAFPSLDENNDGRLSKQEYVFAVERGEE